MKEICSICITQELTEMLKMIKIKQDSCKLCLGSYSIYNHSTPLIAKLS